ncbi:MAG TPA: SGNH/GDSL hydrolase family protein [Cytophagaceae bacterium]|nr:SGNH/GDSL hydrolase family protein [Cytophagaceae bacterium]
MSAKLYLFNLSILTILLFSECRNKEFMDDPIPSETTTINTSLRYLALGDSYTKAECEKPSNSYPAMIVQKLSAQGINVQEQKTIAQTGWTTADLKNAITQAGLKDTFELVSLLIGVNNQYQGRSPEEYRVEFLELLHTSIAFAGGRKDKVFVLSIPDYGYTPFGSSNQAYISTQINLFNSINKAISDSLGVKYFDITPISRNAQADPSLICTDHLHPSAKMYTQWVELMYADLVSMVK